MVDGLLDFARSGGSLRPMPHASVNHVLKGAVEDARPAAEDAAIELTQVTIASCEVGCAPGVLRALLSNLLNNAIKFKDDSKTRRIAVRAPTNKRYVRVEVEDTGPGFPAAFESIVFDPYARATTQACPGELHETGSIPISWTPLRA